MKQKEGNKKGWSNSVKKIAIGAAVVLISLGGVAAVEKAQSSTDKSSTEKSVDSQEEKMKSEAIQQEEKKDQSSIHKNEEQEEPNQSLQEKENQAENSVEPNQSIEEAAKQQNKSIPDMKAEEEVKEKEEEEVKEKAQEKAQETEEKKETKPRVDEEEKADKENKEEKKQENVSSSSENKQEQASAQQSGNQTTPSTPELPTAPSNEENQEEKVVYLTFDDGPSTHTQEILQILDAHNAKGTFFMLGPNMKRFPEATKAIVEGGHGPALHGVSHDAHQIYQSKDTVVGEMKEAQNDLYHLTGVRTNLIRTPYGSVPYMKPEYLEAVHQNGFELWDWNIDSLDWKYKDARYVNGVIHDVETKSFKEPVILLHDKQTTAQHLNDLLDYLSAHGYKMKPLDDTLPVVHF
ncbi:polysaccharide deacetylase family protein [Priestia filamentosa]|uniref:polysaccharide deacetylase family protein n=1 Tax=Priestia filamentosa TaxID=1402861 RepID=UPI001FB26B21|nr:polysaccharide deacetylase family protein [Priestia filamentosa]UOE62139.1 polysaccharide deacetylase family protein [Priestia filamentosa]